MLMPLLVFLGSRRWTPTPPPTFWCRFFYMGTFFDPLSGEKTMFSGRASCSSLASTPSGRPRCSSTARGRLPVAPTSLRSTTVAGGTTSSRTTSHSSQYCLLPTTTTTVLQAAASCGRASVATLPRGVVT